MPVEKRQNLLETDRGSYYNKENGQKIFQTVKKHFTMVMKVMVVIMMMRISMKIMSSSSYRRVLTIVATKQYLQFFYQNLAILLSASTVVVQGPAKWRITVSGELRFMTSYLQSQCFLIVMSLNYPNHTENQIQQSQPLTVTLQNIKSVIFGELAVNSNSGRSQRFGKFAVSSNSPSFRVVKLRTVSRNFMYTVCYLFHMSNGNLT